MSVSAPARATWLFCCAVFVSAFLLFQVQPLISKAILPWYGGTPSVWTTCMLFFQVVLFAGYAYAHLVSARLPVRLQAGAHLALLVGAVLLLRILPSTAAKPADVHAPVLQIVQLLAATVGLPYFILSTTGPLLQRWYSLVFPLRSPYRLYALSNAGSLLALLSYPFVFEPWLGMSQQARWWQWGFWAFAGLCAACIARLLHSTRQTRERARSTPAAAPRPAFRRLALWFILALAPSAMLLATTNQVCQNLAVVPFLWVAPLSLYLLSFILCFDSDRWYWRRSWSAAMGACVLAFGWMFIFESAVSLWTQIAVYFGTLLAMCMVCHGELARMRPPPEHLTEFYLTLSAGGAGGGLFVAVLAPLLFSDYWEFHLCLAIGCGAAIATFFHAQRWVGGDRRTPLPALVAAILLLAGVGVMWLDRWQQHAAAIDVDRNFYGVLRAEHVDRNGIQLTVLRNGGIIHGLQFRRPEFQREPTSYYSRTSGVGRVAAVLAERAQPLRIGVVGLGVGTVAAYGRAGDTIRFYEINPADVRMAQAHFSFVSDSAADVEFVVGDARLSLEREPPQQFDLLILDAFLGDAVPTHLLTRQAMEVYLRHMRDDGIIAIHVSNMHFDLYPVAAGLAAEFDLTLRAIDDPGGGALGHPSSSWVLLARDANALSDARLTGRSRRRTTDRVLWTDDHSNAFELLR